MTSIKQPQPEPDTTPCSDTWGYVEFPERPEGYKLVAYRRAQVGEDVELCANLEGYAAEGSACTHYKTFILEPK